MTPPETLEKLGGLCFSCLSAFAMEGEESEGSGSHGPDLGAPPKDLPLEVGATFRNLKVVELLGWGGMGVVYKCRQTDLNRFVALKVINTALASDVEFARRFNGEAKALAALNHPNIVQVFDFGREGSLYFLVMEHVDGVSVRSLIVGGPVKPPEALRLVTQICTALEYAHSQGVIHRDIKPENILIDRQGSVKIADFGLAKIIDESAPNEPITRTSQVLGTLNYVAPEILAREPADHRGDIYSLGVVFYEMLTGEIPVGRFAAPSKRVQIDVRMDAVVLKALEREPGRRYQRAEELKAKVDDLRQPPTSRLLRRPLALVMAAIVAIVALGVVLKMTRHRGPEHNLSAASPSGINRWHWGNRGEIKETTGDEIVVPPYRNSPMITVRPEGNPLGDYSTIQFKLRYEINPKEEPWILLMFDGLDRLATGSKTLILFPQGDHSVAFAQVLDNGSLELMDQKTLPKNKPVPSHWHAVEVSWDGAQHRLGLKVDGDLVYEKVLEDSEDLSGSWRFGFGGASREIRIKEVKVANVR